MMYDETKHDFVAELVDCIVGEMDSGGLRQDVWDSWYDKLIFAEWEELEEYAEEFDLGVPGLPGD
jgi:hypothetical protein